MWQLAVPAMKLSTSRDPVVVDGVVQVGEMIGDVELEVGAGGVDEHDVQVEVQQVRHRAEDLRAISGSASSRKSIAR